MNKYESGKDFVMLSRDYIKDIEEELLTFDEYGGLTYLFQKANPVTGKYIANVIIISQGIGIGKKKADYIILNTLIEIDKSKGCFPSIFGFITVNKHRCLLFSHILAIIQGSFTHIYVRSLMVNAQGY